MDISQDYAYILPIKVELAEVNFDSLIEKLPNILEPFKKNAYPIYLKDMDITRDFRGNLSKKKLKDYLIKSLGYVMEGDNK